MAETKLDESSVARLIHLYLDHERRKDDIYRGRILWIASVSFLSDNCSCNTRAEGPYFTWKCAVHGNMTLREYTDAKEVYERKNFIKIWRKDFNTILRKAAVDTEELLQESDRDVDEILVAYIECVTELLGGDDATNDSK